MASAPITVTADWLKGALADGAKNLVVLDSTWVPQVKVEGFPETTGLALYESKHIPGAHYFDLDACITKTQLIPRTLPEQAAFQDYVRSLGIGTNSHVICYDRDDGELMTTAGASRTSFTLKLYGHDMVSVLVGGLLQWEEEGNRIEKGQPTLPQPGDFLVNFHKEMVVDFDTVREIEDSGSHQLVDTRLEINFNAEESEPCAFTQLVLMDANLPIPTEMKKGHMKNAINIGFDKLFKDKISFKSKQDLHKLFHDAGVDFEKPTVVTCYIGHTAAMWYLLGTDCGVKDIKVYYGSWTEYGQRTTST